jgi:four helix bundle protein
MKAWTFALAVQTVVFTKKLSGKVDVREPLLRQLLRSGTAIPAHYRSACRAQSRRDFITKMKRLEEEADESELWLALLRATGLPRSFEPECRALENECHQVVAIAVQSVKTARRKLTEGRLARSRTA